MRIQSIELNNSRVNTGNKGMHQPSFKRDWSEHISWGANYIKKTGKTNFKLFSFPDAKAVLLEVTKNAKLAVTDWWEHKVNIKNPEQLASATAVTVVASISPLDKKSLPEKK